MNAIYFDIPLSDEKKRELLYRGQLLVYPATPSSLKLVNLARSMAEAAFTRTIRKWRNTNSLSNATPRSSPN